MFVSSSLAGIRTEIKGAGSGISQVEDKIKHEANQTSGYYQLI